MFKDGMIGNGTFMKEINDILTSPTKFDPRQSSSHEARAAIEAKFNSKKNEQEEDIEFADGPKEENECTVQSSSSSDDEQEKKPIETKINMMRNDGTKLKENIGRLNSNTHNRP